MSTTWHQHHPSCPARAGVTSYCIGCGRRDSWAASLWRLVFKRGVK